jgi:hypothetical protein
MEGVWRAREDKGVTQQLSSLCINMEGVLGKMERIKG